MLEALRRGEESHGVREVCVPPAALFLAWAATEAAAQGPQERRALRSGTKRAASRYTH